MMQRMPSHPVSTQKWQSASGNGNGAEINETEKANFEVKSGPPHVAPQFRGRHHFKPHAMEKLSTCSGCGGSINFFDAVYKKCTFCKKRVHKNALCEGKFFRAHPICVPRQPKTHISAEEQTSQAEVALMGPMTGEKTEVIPAEEKAAEEALDQMEVESQHDIVELNELALTVRRKFQDRQVALDRIKQEHEQNVAVLKQKFESQIRELKNNSKQNEETLRRDYEKQLADLNKLAEERVATVTQTFEQRLLQLAVAHKGEMKKLSTNHSIELQRLSLKFQTVIEGHAADISQLNSALESRDAEIERMHAEHREEIAKAHTECNAKLTELETGLLTSHEAAVARIKLENEEQSTLLKQDFADQVLSLKEIEMSLRTAYEIQMVELNRVQELLETTKQSCAEHLRQVEVSHENEKATFAANRSIELQRLFSEIEEQAAHISELALALESRDAEVEQHMDELCTIRMECNREVAELKTAIQMLDESHKKEQATSIQQLNSTRDAHQQQIAALKHESDHAIQLMIETLESIYDLDLTAQYEKLTIAYQWSTQQLQVNHRAEIQTLIETHRTEMAAEVESNGTKLEHAKQRCEEKLAEKAQELDDCKKEITALKKQLAGKSRELDDNKATFRSELAASKNLADGLKNECTDKSKELDVCKAAIENERKGWLREKENLQQAHRQQIKDLEAALEKQSAKNHLFDLAIAECETVLWPTSSSGAPSGKSNRGALGISNKENNAPSPRNSKPKAQKK